MGFLFLNTKGSREEYYYKETKNESFSQILTRAMNTFIKRKKLKI